MAAVGVTASVKGASEGGVTVGKKASATVSPLSDQSWYFSRARNLLRVPHVRHLTTKCFSRAAESVVRGAISEVSASPANKNWLGLIWLGI